MKESRFKVEYEIPPLRAIYTIILPGKEGSEIRDSIEKHQKLWKIRKIEKLLNLTNL